MANKRNSNNTGSIIKRKDGTFTVRMQKGLKENGKPNIKERRAKNQIEAEEKLKEIILEFEEDQRRKTVGFKEYSTERYFKLFLEYKQRVLSATSYERLKSTITTHIVPNVGMVKFCDLKSKQIQSILDTMYQNQLSYSSIKKVYDAFNSCYKWSVNKRKDLSFEENPMLEVEMITTKKFKKKKIRSFTEDEIQRFKEEALRTYSNGNYVHKLGPAFILMLNTGIREGELCAINKDDIEQEQLNIHNTAVTIRNENVETLWDKKWVTIINENDTKTTSGNRVLPLNQTSKEMIQILQNIFVNHQDNNLLIYTKKGEPMPPANLVKPFKNICYNAKIKNIKGHGPHVLRHTFATQLFDKGFKIKVVSELLGHKDVYITQNTYIDVINRKKIEAINMIEI